MGIYNCEDTLREAVESILQQSISEWELIMCDDGSTDGTFELAKTLAASDSRISLVQNEHNYGLGYALNQCLKQATGVYIARMDGDDRCSPVRLQKQLEFMSGHTEFAICSTPMILFDETGEWGRTKLKEQPSKEDVVTGAPIHHAPVMIRREALESIGGYSTSSNTLRVEDVDLWIRLYYAGYRCYNLQEALYSMRDDRNAFQRRKYRYRINSTIIRLKGCQMMHLGIKSYLLSFLPMIVGLIPERMRRGIRKRRGA